MAPRIDQHLCRYFSALIVATAVSAYAGPANAAIIEANTVACTNDINQSCDTSNFLSAVGGGPLDVSLDLVMDKNGNIPAGGPVSGDIFSDDVTFSSEFSTLFGIGLNSSDVQYSAPTALRSQIGAVDGGGGFRGALIIDFANPVSAVGFTTISLETNGVIELFDPANSLIATIASPSNTVLDYVGLVATAGEEISRIRLDGDFFAIRDIQFNFVQSDGPESIPSPSALILAVTGFIAWRFRCKLDRFTRVGRSV